MTFLTLHKSFAKYQVRSHHCADESLCANNILYNNKFTTIVKNVLNDIYGPSIDNTIDGKLEICANLNSYFFDQNKTMPPVLMKSIS